MTVIHRKISYKLLFTEKYDTKSPLSSFEGYSPSITTVVPGKKKQCCYVSSWLYLWKKSQIFIVFILIYLFEKNISPFFFVENRTFILCKHFFHCSETCQHISLIIGCKRKNAYTFGICRNLYCCHGRN